MIDLREKVKKIINAQKEKGKFSVLGDEAPGVIQQIFNNYEQSNNLHQDFENIPKNAELIFVAAPTGAGKDNLVVKLNLQNPDKNYIELNMDIFRHYYSEFLPNVNELADKTFAVQTNKFSYELYMTIQEILLTEFPGTNIIITGTIRETDWVEETFRKYKNNPYTNYTIKLASLAVPKKESAISVIQRYVMIVDARSKEDDFIPGTARYTTKDYHDETYEKFPQSLAYFENIDYKIDENGKFVKKPAKECLIDVFEVYKRNKVIYDYSENTLMYSSEREYNKSSSALEAVEKLRNAPVKISHSDMGKLLHKIYENRDYFKSQGTFKEIVLDMAILLDYEHVVNKIKMIDSEITEQNDEPDL